MILSAKEIDVNGSIVAQGDYSYDKFPNTSTCRARSDYVGEQGFHKYKNSFILNDHNGSPYITCQVNEGIVLTDQ